MKRYPTDLSHYAFQCGDIGKLQTISCIPVMAGDSISLDFEGVFRLSPLRRNLVVDCCVEIFGFYDKHRHTYGADWITFIKDGVREAITFPSVSEASEKYYLGTFYSASEAIPTGS